MNVQSVDPARPVISTPQPLDYAAPAPARYEAVDLVRLCAAAAIVFVHAAKSPIFTGGVVHFFRFAVPFYLFASLYFQSASLRRNADRSLATYIIKRTKRLYLPFLAWGVIYLLARDLRRTYLLHLGPVQLKPLLLWQGSEYHLWFLPFLLFWSIVLACIYYGVLRYDRRWRWPLMGLFVALGIFIALSPMPSSWDETFDNPTYALVQNWRAMPAVCFAMAFAWFMTMGPVQYTIPKSLGVAGIVLAFACSFIQAFRGMIMLIPRALSGLGCIFAALAPWDCSKPPLSTLAALGRNSFGVYLNHLIVVEVIHAVTTKLHMPESPRLDLITFAFGLAGSLTLVMLFAKSKWTAWLNG